MSEKSGQNKSHQSSVMFAWMWPLVKLILTLLLGLLLMQAFSLLLLCNFGTENTDISLNQLLLAQLGTLQQLGITHPMVAVWVDWMVDGVQCVGDLAYHLVGQVGTYPSAMQYPTGFIDPTSLLPAVSSWGGIAIKTLQLGVLKLLVILLMLPMFGWFGLVGLVEGLVARDLRTFGGGRESSLLYHSARNALTPIVLLAVLLWMVLPMPIAPELLLLPFLLLFGIATKLGAGSFKKYL